MTQQTAIILIGLPGSGKSTWAKEKFMKADGEKWIIINNDSIRVELFSEEYEWSPKLESQVKAERLSRLSVALAAGQNVIVDNTHLNPKTLRKLRDWIQRNFSHVLIEEKSFVDVPVHTCIERDMKRQEAGERFVGAQVILEMARGAGIELQPPNPYDPSLPWAIISDLDGTLALFGNRRNPYDASTCHIVDEPNPVVLNILKTYMMADMPEPDVSKVFFFSGRKDKYKEQTTTFLREKCTFNIDSIGKFFELHMRKTGDDRSDAIVKKEMYDAHIAGKYNVFAVFDDRPAVCQLWRSLGLPLLQVGPGDKFDF